MIFVFRVTTGQEKMVSEMLYEKAKANKLDIYSIIVLENVRGYLFVEAEKDAEALKLAQKTKHVKGMLRKTITIEELQKMFVIEKPTTLIPQVGDIVEITSGPFKGEKAKLIKVVESRDEVIVEPLEVAVPIPITTKSKMIKIVEKKKDQS